MKQQKLFAAILCAVTPLAYAATGDISDEIVVTATRMSQSLDKSIEHTTVINAQEIRLSGAPDVLTLIRSLAGVEVTQSGGLGKLSGTFMRGTNSSHVLVLLDGVRVNSATAGTTALENIMLDSLERIEVVRGNVSSLYGSEAIGGVIQLFTKRGRGVPALNVSAGLGSHGSQRLSAGFAGALNETSFSVNAGKVRTDGTSAINTQIAPTANPNNNGYDNTTFSAQLQHALGARHQLSATLFSSRGDNSYDKSGSFLNTPTDLYNGKSNIEKISVASDNYFTDAWHSHLALARGTDDARDYKNAVQQSQLTTTSDQVAWQNELLVSDNRKLNLAWEHLGQAVSAQDIATPDPYTKTQRTVNSLLGGYVGEYGMHQVQLNLRQDRYSDFGTANTGLLGYSFAFADSWRATATLSSAFRAPSFNDLYRPSWGANPDLRPEHANNREIGLRYASGGQRADMIYFDNRIRDLIAYKYPALVNINRARIDGVEANYAGKFGDTELKASATLQNPRDELTGKALLRRAREFASIAVTHTSGAWSAGAELQHSGTRTDIDINTFSSTTLPGYRVVNLNARYQVDKNLAISARMDNLFNRDYMLVHGYNTQGRAVFVGLNYQQ